jgi:glutathione synthase/RimK-type ligase-like ATP-grasp enzyme
MKFGYVPATQAQREFLKRKGVEPVDLQAMSKFAASKLIDRMIQRQNKKLATANQLRLLESKGIPVPRTATFEQASNAISYIASKSWKFYDKSHALSFFR